MMGLPTTGTRAAHTNSISCSENMNVHTTAGYVGQVCPTKLVRPAVCDGCPVGSVHYGVELEDVNRRSGGHEENTEGYAHLVEPV